MIGKIKRLYADFFTWYWPAYFVGGISLILTYILELLIPRWVGWGADRIMDQTMTDPALLRLVIALILMTAVKYITNYVAGYRFFNASDHSERFYRRRLYEKILRQGPDFFRKNQTGTLMNYASSDVSEAGEFTGWGFYAFFDSIIWPLSIVGFMLVMSWRMTLLSLAVMMILGFVYKKLIRRVYTLFDERQEAVDLMNQSVLEGVRGVRLIRAYALEQDQARRFGQQALDLNQKELHLATLNQRLMLISRCIPELSYTLVLAMAYFELRSGSLTLGQFIIFSQYVTYLVWPMMALGEFFTTLQYGMGAKDRMQDVLELPELRRQADLPFPESPELTIRDLSFRFPDSERDALQGVHFHLPAGASLGIVGPVGAGKSTLLRLLLDFLEPSSGSIDWSGHLQQDYDPASLREAIAYVAQDPFLFSRSVQANILLGAKEDLDEAGRQWREVELMGDTVTEAKELSPEIEARLHDVLSKADFLKDVAQLPDGLASECGEKGISLSGGQKQRISIARALIKEAKVLLLDDCLSAVDAVTEQNILKALRSEAEARSLMIVAHRLSAVKDCDQILVLDAGRQIALGTHEELMQQGGWYAEQYVRQFGKGA